MPIRSAVRAAPALIAAALLAAAIPASRADVVVPPPAELGPLTPVLPSGTEGAWSTQLTPNGFAMTNAAEPGAVRYYWAALPEAPKVRVSATVSLAPTGEGFSGAGLIYAFQPEAATYMAVILSANDTVSVYARDAAGFQQMSSTSQTGLVKPEGNLIEIIGQGREMQVTVNGMAVISTENSLIAPTAAGFIGVGTGTFVLTRYEAGAAP